MALYPYSAPIIMTDDIFVSYGGITGSSLALQRQAAYAVAEERMSGHLHTLLLPTTVTGSFTYSPVITTDFGYIDNVSLIQFVDTKEDVYYTISGTANIYAGIRDAELGIVDIFYVMGTCGCSWSSAMPYKVDMVYTAGLPTGVATQDYMLLGLTTVSQGILNEIVGYGNESAGDIGVQSFDNQEYSEVRVKLGRTAFGTSAKAQFVKNLVRRLVRYRFIRL